MNAVPSLPPPIPPRPRIHTHPESSRVPGQPRIKR